MTGMAAQTFILFIEPSRWRIALAGAARTRWIDLPVASDAPPEEIAAQVAGALAGAGYRGGAVTLAIPSAWCLVASIATNDLPWHDRRIMCFRLEEKLPLAAEEFVADFIDAPEGALGVCVRTDMLKPLVDALEQRAVAIESIVPAALLAAHGLAAAPSRASAAAPHLLLLGDGGLINVITMENDRPVAWSLARANEAELKLHIDMARHRAGSLELGAAKLELHAEPERRAAELELRACGVDAELLASFANFMQIDDTPSEAAIRAARPAQLGRARPWIELRRDALAARDRLRAHRRALNAMLAAAALLLLALAGITLLRGARYEAFTRDREQQLIDAFRSEFPGWTVPANVRALIDSEHRKLAAQQAGAARQAAAESALSVLVRVLGTLPAESRLVAQRMTFDDRGFVIEGRIASPAELDALTTAIRAAGLRVAPPEHHRDEAGAWRFTLRGELPAQTSPPARVAEVK